MSTLRARLALSVALVLAVSVSAFAQERGHPVLVFKDGRRMQVKSYDTRGTVTNVVDLNGGMVVVKTDLIDFDKSRRATEAAMRPATPTPTPVKKKSIVEVAREMQEKRRHGNDPVPGIPDKTPAAATPKTGSLPAPTVATDTRPAPTAPPVIPTPAPTEAAAATPPPATTPTPAATEPPAEEPGISPLVLYGGIGGVLALVAIGGFVALGRKGAAKPKSKVAKKGAPAEEPISAGRAAPEEELLTPAFARDDSAEDLPVPLPVSDEELSTPGELTGAGGGRKALTTGDAASSSGATPAPSFGFPTAPAPELPAQTPGILEEGREVQIRIGADVYTCPDLATLRRWVEEGRVIETSEVLAPDGSWLMAGSIPDLESAFERRRETLGY